MEALYQSLLSNAETLTEQLKVHLFDMTEPEGPVLILVNGQGTVWANHPGRIAFLNEDSDILSDICRQIADGYDPCVCAVEGGCVVGTQLITEKVDCGCFLVFLPGYGSETIHANMDIFELFLAQMQLICQLIEKNNQLHHRQLTRLSRQSLVFSGR